MDNGQLVDATLTQWEDGCDLLISGTAPADKARVWGYLTDPNCAADWFAPWTLDGDAITFEWEDGGLAGEVIGCEPGEYVLVELPFGRVGISLREDGQVSGVGEEDDLGDGGAGAASTRISLTHTFETLEQAAEALADLGPVWDTHLRMLLAELGATDTEVDEASQAATYLALAEQARIAL